MNSCRQSFISVAVIVAAAVAVYAVTLDVPWYMDDFSSITANPRIRNLGTVLGQLGAPRALGDLTFALNFRWGGLSVAGYHATNIAIHAAAGLFAAAILQRLGVSALLSCLGALIFVCHPLQTQAVTYVVQRYASLAGMFFLAAVWFYLVASEWGRGGDSRQPQAIAAYIAAVVCGWAAVSTKQNAAVLPGILFLLDRFLIRRDESCRKAFVRALPFVAAPLWMAYLQLVAPVAGGQPLAELTSTDTFSGTRVLTPFNYFLTELGVIWRYFGLLLLPVGQRLDYDIPLASGVTVWHVFLGAGLIGVAAVAFILRRRTPYLAVGVFWFFLTLAVESSFIPLDPMFEHRLYLPLFGFVLCLVEGLRRLPSRTVLVIAVPLVAVYAGLAVSRNLLWRDTKAFFEDNMRKSPYSPRPYLPVAKALIKEGRPKEALVLLDKALPLDPTSYLLYDAFGIAYHVLGRHEDSISHFRTSISLKHDYPDAHTNLGTVFADQGRWTDAEAEHREALKHRPQYGIARYNLGVALFGQKRYRESFEAFSTAANLLPEDADALYNAAIAGIESGDSGYARNALARLQLLNPDRAKALAVELQTKYPQ